MILAVTVIAYGPSFSVPFQFDDYARITGNWNLRAGNWLRGIGQLGGSRVLPAVTVAFNYWLSGDETWSYHVVNLAIHLTACAAVFYLAWLVTRTPRLQTSAAARHPLAFAAASAAFFACHPLQTQAVTYIIQRAASMATLFYVASVCAYLAGRLAQARGSASARRRFAAAIVLALAALLSKENAITLPLAIAVVEVTCFGRRHLRRLVRAGLLVAPLLATPLVWKVVAWRWRGNVEAEGGPLRQAIDALLAQGLDSPGAVGPVDYFLTQMLVLPRYLRLVVFPVGLNVDHDVRLASGVDVGVVAGMLALLVLLATGLWALRRVPVVGLGIVWFFIAVSVESSFIPIHDVMMEHRMYLAMPGLSLIFAVATARLLEWNHRAAATVAVVVVGLLATLTFARNQVWQSALSLWSDAAAKSPGKARVFINVGVAHHGRDELDEAIAQYCRAIEIDPDIALARENIEIALEQQGRLDEVLEQLTPRRVEVPGAPPGSIILEYDPSQVVCANSRADHRSP